MSSLTYEVVRAMRSCLSGGSPTCRCEACEVKKSMDFVLLLYRLAKEKAEALIRGDVADCAAEEKTYNDLLAQLPENDFSSFGTSFETHYREAQEEEPMTLTQEQLTNLMEEPYDEGCRELMGRAVRYLVQQNEEETLSPLSIEEDRQVELLTIQGHACVVKKTVEDPVEILVHQELVTSTAHDRHMKQLLPSLYSARRKGEKYEVYMERVDGPTLNEAFQKELIDGDELMTTLLVLHSFLAYTRKTNGFTHGDLTLNNVVLRGLGRGKVHRVPIMTGPGKAMLVSLSFCPVVIDFGLSMTRKFSFMHDYLTPFSGDLLDIARLYQHISIRVDGKEDGFVSVTHEHLNVRLGEGWGVCLFYPVPLPLLCKELTHEAIITRYLEGAEE